MTRHNYVGCQVSSSSRIDYIFFIFLSIHLYLPHILNYSLILITSYWSQFLSFPPLINLLPSGLKFYLAMSPGGVSKKTLLNPSKKLLMNALSANGICLRKTYWVKLINLSHNVSSPPEQKSVELRIFLPRLKPISLETSLA